LKQFWENFLGGQKALWEGSSETIDWNFFTYRWGKPRVRIGK
jgi:hypothetical protein